MLTARRRSSSADYFVPFREGDPFLRAQVLDIDKNMATTTPPSGEKITISGGKLKVPNNPIIPFIRGDGTGPDIWAASERVFDAAVQKAYGKERKISWF